ncbi:hypothetical protein DFH07DRAFT_32325 [Mycena maculata]|uniref:Uncharacterized protein n=1 Tax=Mycena maculata TaxID=230809 RepID=A0AAD7K2E8_9AGAR|nr:hypothetical protein DFH07DRAFT_32325 [Mycena maculata]
MIFFQLRNGEATQAQSTQSPPRCQLPDPIAVEDGQPRALILCFYHVSETRPRCDTRDNSRPWPICGFHPPQTHRLFRPAGPRRQAAARGPGKFDSPLPGSAECRIQRLPHRSVCLCRAPSGSVQAFVLEERERPFLKALFTQESVIPGIEEFYRRISALANAFQGNFSLVKHTTHVIES